ncbi:hypothetical protein V8J36_18905 [Frigidibacter sp. MR17.14]|uniref:hypothetical protein n=1 Tax=Frigidibacter sp. MR17.14 TaxID=3126509 RepID=UPI0030131E04
MKLLLSSGLAPLALVGGLALSPASAATVTFTLDRANSAIALAEDGVACLKKTTCGVTADLAFAEGTAITLDEGASQAFDLISWTGFGSGTANYDVQLTLAFSTPAVASVTGLGSASALTFKGVIIAGALDWSSVTPLAFDGIDATLSLASADGLVLSPSVTTGAKLTLNGVTPPPAVTPDPTPAPVPLPAAGALLAAAIGGLAGLRRRGRKA